MFEVSGTVHREMNPKYKVSSVYIQLCNGYIFISTAIITVSNQKCKKSL